MFDVRWLLVGGLAVAQSLGAADWPSPYAPPQWQTLISLVEDSSKSLVDHHGTLLYDHGKGGGEFATRIGFGTIGGTEWCGQRLLAPQVPVVETHWEGEGITVFQEAFAMRRQDLGDAGGAHGSCATQRLDGVIMRLYNWGERAITIYPTATVFTVFGATNHGQRVELNSGAWVLLDRAPVGEVTKRRGYHFLPLPPVEVVGGGVTNLALIYGCGAMPDKVEVPTMQRARERMVDYWRVARLPYDKIVVPDATVQSLIDSSIRNMWQARDRRGTKTLFQPGATCYRGLWIVDGAFMAQTATMLGAVAEARETLHEMLSHQKEHGGIELIRDFHKENGIVLWAFCEHARLTADREWLRAYWPRLLRVAARIKELRRQSRLNESELDDGLIPAGFPDGGLARVVPEYSNVLWSLSGLKMFYETATWLGEDAAAQEWRAEYQEFMEAMQKAARRDMRSDNYGNRYLPNYMGSEAEGELPQRGLWSFCLAIHPGKIFAADSAVVGGTLAMLRSRERQGVVVGSGWHEDGVWSYFTSFYGHAWLWRGDGRKASRLLEAFAAHAAPTYLWCEEHSLVGAKHKKIGDMPHAWAAAEFVRFTRNTIALERGSELHLFQGLPTAWCGPGMVTRLNRVATHFGALSCELAVSADGREIHFSCQPLSDSTCTALVVHTEAWGGRAAPVMRFNPQQQYKKQVLKRSLP